jgi:hypothetical protein
VALANSPMSRQFFLYTTAPSGPTSAGSIVRGAIGFLNFDACG